MVQGDVEDVEIAQPLAGLDIGMAGNDQRHLLFGNPAVGAQRLLQLAQVVAVGGGARKAESEAADSIMLDSRCELALPKRLRCGLKSVVAPPNAPRR